MPIKRLSKEEAIALAKGPLSGEVLRLAASYVQPIFWLTGPVGSGLIRNGTTFVVDAGQGLFGVTAGHVVDAYREFAQGNPSAVCHVGTKGLKINPLERLIARGHTSDIATYRINRDEVDRLDLVIRQEPTWPPPRPAVDRGVFYAGFPGQARKLVDDRTIEWGIYGAGGISTAVNDDSIVCQMERENAIQVLGLPIPEVGYEVGGLSGAPLFAFWETEATLHWRLAGVIYEGGGVMFEHIRAAHADRIRADGTIDD